MGTQTARIPRTAGPNLHIRFLALRYGSILATFPVLFLSTAENVHCQVAASFTQVGVVLVVASSGIIFAIRTSLLWSDDWNVRGALSGLLGIVTVCWVCTFRLSQSHN